MINGLSPFSCGSPQEARGSISPLLRTFPPDLIPRPRARSPLRTPLPDGRSRRAWQPSKKPPQKCPKTPRRERFRVGIGASAQRRDRCRYKGLDPRARRPTPSSVRLHRAPAHARNSEGARQAGPVCSQHRPARACPSPIGPRALSGPRRSRPRQLANRVFAPMCRCAVATRRA